MVARVFWNVNIRSFNFVNVYAWVDVYNICIMYGACTPSYCSKSVLNYTQK